MSLGILVLLIMVVPETKLGKPWILVVLGFMGVFGVSMLFLYPWLSKLAMASVLSLRNSATFDLWKKNPIPIFLEFFLFNWTNPHELYNPDVNPHFTEIGPFVFEEIKERVNITFNENNTVTFKQKHTFFFREEMSVAPLSMNITTVNAIAASASYIIRDWNFVLRKGFDWSLRTVSQKMYTTKTAGEFIFFGYDNPLILMARTVPNFHGVEVPDWDKFAWFYKRNDSSDIDGVFNMYSSGENFGHMKNWNYKSNMSIYHDDCDKIKGPAGEMFGPNRKRNQIGFFSTDICRYVQLDYVKDEEINGIQGYRYELGDGFFSTKDHNSCYCSGGSCSAPYGAVNVSACKFGAPGFVSRPHFLGADEYYLNSVDGMQPDERKHQMYLTVEPTTGIPLEVEARFQLNVLLEKIDYVSMFENLPRELYIPVLWVQQKAKIPYSFQIILKIYLNIPSIFKWTGVVLILLVVPLFTIILYKPILNRIRWRATRRKNIRITFNDSECGLSLVNGNKLVVLNQSSNSNNKEIVK
ncbi:protein croquemort-like isoform X1 [Onthophagus taurus]|uniref:protein croquemort-like isoform X1 n=2 Tax=Onthophagus taurus TaxID=166361 RepID=UPI0039BE7A92